MTFSIVARDETSGNLGIAVASHWFNSASDVSWIESGVGACAVQAVLGKESAIEIGKYLRGGMTADDALAAILRHDQLASYRQIAIVDNAGRIAAHTGENCIAFASHLQGNGFCVQANIMTTDQVVPAMHSAYSSSKEPFARRLLAALQAGQAAGGDLRGQQSAGMLICSGQPETARILDLQVPDHKQPLTEMSRLLELHNAYQLMNLGDNEIASAKIEAAIAAYKAAVEAVPDNIECRYWYAVTLLNAGRHEQAQEIMQEIYDKNQDWKELSKRLLVCGILQSDVSELA